jgi:hypothetical protein
MYFIYLSFLFLVFYLFIFNFYFKSTFQAKISAPCTAHFCLLLTGKPYEETLFSQVPLFDTLFHYSRSITSLYLDKYNATKFMHADKAIEAGIINFEGIYRVSESLLLLFALITNKKNFSGENCNLQWA